MDLCLSLLPKTDSLALISYKTTSLYYPCAPCVFRLRSLMCRSQKNFTIIYLSNMLKRTVALNWWWELFGTDSESETFCSSSFHASQTPHPPTSSLEQRTRPAKLLCPNCHQCALCSYLSVTLSQLWKTFIPFTVSVSFRSPPYNYGR